MTSIDECVIAETGDLIKNIDLRIEANAGRNRTKWVGACVHGEVVPAPRMTRRDRFAKRPCVVRYFECRDRISRAIFRSGGLPGGLVLFLSVHAAIEMPNSWSKKKKDAMDGRLHRHGKDSDNILKTVMDAIWKNDSSVSASLVIKTWGRESMLELGILFELPRVGCDEVAG